MMKLRDYQQDVVDLALGMNDGDKYLMALAVGTGKTVIFASLCASIPGRALILVPSSELREQAYEKLMMVDNTLDVGHVQADLDEVGSKIVIATRQSLTHAKSNRIERMLESGEFEYVICDEGHEGVGQLKKVLAKLNKNIKTIGFTATPYNSELSDVFEKINYSKGILEMIMDNHLTEPRAIMVSSKTSLADVSMSCGEFNSKELELAINNSYRNELIVEAYKQYAGDRKSTLVFAVGINHCRELAEEFNRQGIYCKAIDSNVDKDDRAEIIEEYKSGELPVVCNVGVLTRGFDAPRTDCIILARPTRSRILYEQIIGRGLRLYENKPDCLIVDICDVVRGHNLMNMESVFDVPLKHRESVKEAMYRAKQEEVEIAEKKKIREAEEKVRMELVAKEIKLFNKNMKLAFNKSYFDWFNVQLGVYAISKTFTDNFIIENIGDEFNVYKANCSKENKSIELIETGSSLKELIETVEKNYLCSPTSFAIVDAKWKLEKVTDSQKKYCSWATNKWQVHTYFTSSTIKGMLKKLNSMN